MKIQIEHQPDRSRLEQLDVFNWSIWSKDVSEFAWTYDTREICYFLAGAATVTPDGSHPVSVGKGDLVTFPRGMTCRWRISEPVSKHYLLG
jgi:uncharacterized protein